MKRLVIGVLVGLLTGAPGVLASHEGEQYTPRQVARALETSAERELRITTANKEKMRRRLRRAVYGGAAPGHRVPVQRTREIGGNVRYARAVHALEMRLEKGLRARPLLFRSARARNRRLVIYHAGHEHPILRSSRRQIEFFLARGYDVAALSMPLYEFNAPSWMYEHPTCGRLDPHELLGCLLKRPLRPFLAPVAITLNTLAGRYHSVDMAGFSGGGWTAVVAAAIDRRIRRSYPIAGSWPIYLVRRFGNPLHRYRGDFEFEYRPMLRAASYLDMYALANDQLAIWIKRDDCCFRGLAYRSFVPAVRRVNPNFRTRLDTVAIKHEVSGWALRMVARDMRRR